MSGRAPGPRHPAGEPRSVCIGGERLEFLLKRSAKRKSVGLTVRDSQSLEVAAPAKMKLADVDAVVRERARWVRKKWAMFADLEQSRQEATFAPGERWPFRGASYPLQIVERASATPAAVALDEHLNVTISRQLTGDAKREAVRAALWAWYRREAERWLRERVDHYSARYGFAPRAIKVKDVKSRWGSCSVKGNLNFNWRLVLAPPPVVDYVVVHELCHLRHPNHSKRFWNLVRSILPEYETQKAWLRAHGPDLNR